MERRQDVQVAIVSGEGKVVNNISKAKWGHTFKKIDVLGRGTDTLDANKSSS